MLMLAALSAGPRGPVQQQVPPASTFNNQFDVLLVRITADDDETSSATVQRIFRGREQPGPIALQWDIRAPKNSSGPDAHAGDELIVAGVFTASRFFVQAAYQGRELDGKLPPLPRAGPVQLASFLFLFAIPLIQIVLHRLTKRDRRLLKFNLAMPLIGLADYAFYESGIPAYMNIRIDLLLLIPVAALIGLLWVIFAVKAVNARPDAPHPERR